MSRMHKVNQLTLLSGIILVSSCSTCEPIKLNLPPPIIQEVIEPHELGCISDGAYKALVRNDIACTTRVQTLENIIKSVND